MQNKTTRVYCDNETLRMTFSRAKGVTVHLVEDFVEGWYYWQVGIKFSKSPKIYEFGEFFLKVKLRWLFFSKTIFICTKKHHFCH